MILKADIFQQHFRAISFQHIPKDDAEGKYFKEHTRSDRQMFLLASHRERCQGEGAIVEGKLKGHMDSVEEHFLAYEFDLQFLVIKVPSDFSYLAHCVVDEAPAFASIVESQPCVDSLLSKTWVLKIFSKYV